MNTTKDNKILDKCPKCHRGRWLGEKCTNCGAPAKKQSNYVPVKNKTPHRQFIEYFSEMTMRTRHFKPKITGKDAMQLKRVLDGDQIDESKLEQLALYFLGSWRFKNMSPSIATMLSATVLNALLNYMQNREDFYKELDALVSQYMRGEPAHSDTKVEVTTLKAQLDALRKKLSIQ